MGRTQYGMLTSISLRPDGGYINEALVNSGTNLSTVGLDGQYYISFKICIREEAVNKGGVNIFGEKYGDYPQGICMRVVYCDLHEKTGIEE